MVFGLGFPEVGVILLLGILLFGGDKIGSLAKGVGDAIREFKKGVKRRD